MVILLITYLYYLYIYISKYINIFIISNISTINSDMCILRVKNDLILLQKENG